MGNSAAIYSVHERKNIRKKAYELISYLHISEKNIVKKDYELIRYLQDGGRGSGYCRG
jgi:hypothetical protein